MTQEDGTITDKKTITHSSNSHYVNNMKKTSAEATDIEGNPNNKTLGRSTFKSIIKKYEKHSSIININNKVGKSENRHDIPLATAEQINKIIKKLNPNKGTGPDKIPSKIVLLSANIIDCYLANTINHDLDNNSFSEGEKIARVRPIYKKTNRDKNENYRPASILNCFWKIERFLHEQFKPFVETFLSGFAAAWKRYSCNHVLMQLIGNWKRALHVNFQTATILIDLSKAFDCIPHDLLTAKLKWENSYVFLFILKRRGQTVRIDNILSSLQVLISRLPQRSIFDLILFNIFLNDLLKLLKNSDICNFAGDNTFSVASKNRDTLLEPLENESRSAVN